MNNITKHTLAVLAIACATTATAATPDSVNVAFHKVAADDLMGGVSKVDMLELTEKNYNTYSLDAMDAYVGGYNGQLWNQGEALVLVDGVPRDASSVLPSEIESVTFLKSASAVVLYGSRAAKGAILITTKRGKIDGLKISVRGNASTFVPKDYVKYLDAPTYMHLYNEALGNDGKKPVYSDADIYNYTAKTNPYRYPEINYFSSDYLKKTYQRYEGNVEIEGGGSFAHFYTNIGLSTVGDLIKFGEGKDNHTNRLNIRGNIDLKINDWITGWVNGAAVFNDARTDRSGFWAESATVRPTSQYPLATLIPIELVAPGNEAAQNLIANSNYIIDGKYLLGGTQNQHTNAFAAMYAAGHQTFTNRSLQFDAGVKMNLDALLKGLSFRTQFAVDYATSYNTSIANDYATYEAVWYNYNGKDVIDGLNKYGVDKRTATQTVSNSSTRQTMMVSAQFDYNRSFGNHNINASFLGHAYQQEVTGTYHKLSNANLGLQVGYNYQNKYYVDFSGAYVHSAKLAEGNRGAISPVVTAAWRMKGENFLSDVEWLDNLKINASYGVVNQDIDIDNYFLYSDRFTLDNAWWGWNETHGSLLATNSQRGGNKGLDFVKRKEFRVGLDACLWNGAVKVNANYFNVHTNGLLITADNVFPSYFHSYSVSSSFVPYINFNNQGRQGIDFAIDLKKKFGEVELGLGLVGMYFKSENKRISENVEYEWQKQTGASTSAIRGYQCIGFFKDEADVAASAKINNNTKPGDLKYKDQNKDGIIDSKDQVVIGDWTAPFSYGINFTAKWRNFTLFVNATGNAGAEGLKNNQSQWVFGDRKYTEAVLNRWTPKTAATATYPRLTTEGGELNFVNSDFWIYDTSALYLNKVQLTYDLPSKIFENKWLSAVQIYLSGNSLATLGPNSKYMDTNVGAAPKTRSFNLGAKVTF